MGRDDSAGRFLASVEGRNNGHSPQAGSAVRFLDGRMFDHAKVIAPAPIAFPRRLFRASMAISTVSRTARRAALIVERSAAKKPRGFHADRPLHRALWNRQRANQKEIGGRSRELYGRA
jgi:hypothetical protein